MKQVECLIIAGASITNSPWFTWADHIQQILQPQHTVNLAIKGCGNKFITLSLIKHIVQQRPPSGSLIMPMFTMIDKFDQYVDADQAQELSGEKHPPITLEPNYCKSSQPGFWCTGSHFPLAKQFYEENFYNLDWFATDTILNIFSLQQVCKQYELDFFPVFDSDIWNWTEQDYNKIAIGEDCIRRNLLNGDLVKNFKSLLPDSIINSVGLIEYARQNNMPVYNSLNKLHPPSDVHWSWLQSHILPNIENKYVLHPVSQSYADKIQRFTKEWNI
jgi:hypothetical protein